MSFSEASVEGEPADTIFDVHSIESSEDPPMEKWSSVVMEVPEVNAKRLAYEQGLYSPGSGEVCAKYLAVSDSSVYRHPYYNYPSVKDPGIEKALLEPEDRIIYPNDGQKLYLELCKEMNQCPVRLFFNGLLKSEINLSHYCVHPQGVRAMGQALKYNSTVQYLDFTDNFLSVDSCYHLGEMLYTNVTVKELNLTGCRIGPEGLKQLLAGLLTNRTLQILNLHRNCLSDIGGEHLSAAINNGLSVKQMTLSYNGLGAKTAVAMAEVLECVNPFTHLNLSWNEFFSPMGTCAMISRFEESTLLQELDLSWNSMSGPRIASAIKAAMLAPNLRVLNLSNNIFQGDAISLLVDNLSKAKQLHTFNLSFNPLDIADAYKIVAKMRLNSVKVQRLLLENIDVDPNFLLVLARLKRIKSKKNAEIIYGNVVGTWHPKGPDPRELVLNRAEYLAKKPKKNKIDVALVFLKLLKEHVEVLELKSFQDALRRAGAGMLDADLVEEIVNVFPGPKSKKAKTVSITKLVDYVKRKWPGRQLPPTPPRIPTPPPPPTIKGKKGKGKKGKDKKGKLKKDKK